MKHVCLKVTILLCLLAVARGQFICLVIDEPTPTPLNVSYHLYTNNNPTNPVTIRQASDLDSTSFNSAFTTFVLIHGWISNYTNGFEPPIRAALLARYQVNIIAVDWSSIAAEEYNAALCSVPAVGILVGNFINSVLHRFGITGLSLQFIGHSLGAHVSGVAGSNLQSPALQIIGADPAGPSVDSFARDHRLTPDDAVNVQVIHTSTAGYFEPCGTVDYYPNGGQSQPGCDGSDTCSHLRAYEYLAEAIQTSNNFTATLCANYLLYDLNQCSNKWKSLMGNIEVVPTVTASYYLKTNSRSPYARG